MRNDGQKEHQGGVHRPGRTNGFLPSSFRAISSYMRIVSSGASSVARSAVSVASSIVDRDDDDNHDQVIWAGFDKLDCEREVLRRVLLLGYRSGFQVWDVQDADNVFDLFSKHSGPVSFMQMLPRLLPEKKSNDMFADHRPLLVVCMDGSASNCQDQVNSNFMPTILQFYSLNSQSYVHVLKFRSIVYSVRCSSRVIAVSQSTQIHCFDAATLEREYTIITNPVSVGCPGSRAIGYGPLAVGPRWLAYSGSPVAASNSGRVSPQHLTPSASFPGFSSSGGLVAHYAKESSKQLAAGIVTLGDMGYKKLSKYCSELLPDNENSVQPVNPGWKGNGTINGHSGDNESVGVVIVRDMVSKMVIAQFRAHKSPISALCFDPSGTLLVTASIQGHNINVYKIIPGYHGSSLSSNATPSYVHLYRLQRGFTNAVIQDISFSDDSNWIVISSSRGTSHLFAINPCGGFVNIQSSDGNMTSKNSRFDVMTNPAFHRIPNSGVQLPHQQTLTVGGPPVTLSAVNRIRNGDSGWKGSFTGAAAAATGRVGSFSRAIASCFHNCKGNSLLHASYCSNAKYHILVFSPISCMIQYEMRISSSLDSGTTPVTSSMCESAPDSDTRLVVEAVQKWGICCRNNRREQVDNIDIYGENGISTSSKIHPTEEMENGNRISNEIKRNMVKSNDNWEEKHHLYISEAELQMHQSRTPIWAKPEIYFQSMMMDVEMDAGTLQEGEMEIERIPTRMIEPRTKGLIPVFDYIQTAKHQKTRVSTIDSKNKAQLLHQSSWLSENGRISSASSSVSPRCSTNSGEAMFELQGGMDGNGWYRSQMPSDTKGSVNYSDKPRPNTQREIVNNRKSLDTNPELKFVNKNTAGLETHNQFEDGSGDYD